MVKTSDYERMGLLIMQAQNQRETGAKAVKPLLRGGSRHIDRTYQQYTFFGER